MIEIVSKIVDTTLHVDVYLGDNSIVFEYLSASVVDFMVANWATGDALGFDAIKTSTSSNQNQRYKYCCTRIFVL